MNIGIDLDDTINNLADQFLYYAKKYNEEKSIKHVIQENEWDYDKAFGWSLEHQKNFYKTYIKDVLINATIKQNASEIINKLKEEGNKIIIITARCKENHKKMDEITKNWLEENNINYDKLVLNSDNIKAQRCIENNIDVFIDDGINNCIQVYEKLKIPTYMFNSIYNQKQENTHIKRVFSWKQIYDEIQKLL